MALQSVEYAPQGPIRQVVGRTGLVLPSDVTHWSIGAPAEPMLAMLKDILLANGTESLNVKAKEKHIGSMRSIHFSESIRGVPVINGLVAVNYDERTKSVASVVANFVPDRDLPRKPKLSAAQAERTVPGEVNEPTYLAYYLRCCEPTSPNLVWAIRKSEMFYVDAITGVVVDRVPTRLP